MAAAKGKDVETSINLSELDKLTDTQAILQWFAQYGADVDNNEVDGIVSLDIVKEKDSLIGVPFLIKSWRFNEGKYGEFVSAEIVFENGNLAVLNDGSTGIAQQLREVTDNRTKAGHPLPQAGRMVKGGLTRSDYTYVDDKGNDTPAVTYYLQF